MLQKHSIFDVPVTKLSTGMTVANFSSPHDFTFDDGSILKGCSAARSRLLMLSSTEKTTAHLKWVDLEYKYSMSAQVKKELERLVRIKPATLIIIPLPVMLCIKELGIFKKGPFRTIHVIDRINKICSHSKFRL